jgi:hypothetical protein
LPQATNRPTNQPTNRPRLAREQLSAELADARELLASEAAARTDLANALEATRSEAAEARRELEGARAVGGGVCLGWWIAVCGLMTV